MAGLLPVAYNFCFISRAFLAEFKSIQVYAKVYKIAAFMDDILLFLTNPLTSPPAPLLELELFCWFSNLLINYSKCYALNISLISDLVHHCQSIFTFTWKPIAITYLGLQLTVYSAPLIFCNYYKHFSRILNVVRNCNAHGFGGQQSLERAYCLEYFISCTVSHEGTPSLNPFSFHHLLAETFQQVYLEISYPKTFSP